MKSESILHHFQILQQQRHCFFQKIEDISSEQLWHQKEGKWSIGEHLYHLYLITRMLKVATKLSFVLIPYAKMRRKKSFQNQIHDIYAEYKEKHGKGMKAPFILVPPKKVSHALNKEELLVLLLNETNRLKELVENIEEGIAGHIIFFDPLANYPNLIQGIHLLAIHEEHHYKLIEKIMVK
ncbi:DinB family protein [Bacillus sp. BP-3]|uniref:DinB family protein n=1 Tax=Bacillus sp. BP-3 TaxID=3022773 RepID=UPI00232AA7F3|nr:DinB family protein [Bacillus sp. BP-3]MDC2867046.1 DinB family protein [Bacillus sp. BP-3]